VRLWFVTIDLFSTVKNIAVSVRGYRGGGSTGESTSRHAYINTQ